MANRGFTVSRNQGRQELYDHMARSLWPWIETCANVKLNPVEDLAKQLQSGVVLCTLLNHLRPGAITKPIKDDGLVFSAAENIKNFLDACLHQYNMRSVDLFQSGDLVQLSNKLKVLQTLDTLRSLVSPEADQVSAQISGASSDTRDEHTLSSEGAILRMRGRTGRKRASVDMLSFVEPSTTATTSTSSGTAVSVLAPVLAQKDDTVKPPILPSTATPSSTGGATGRRRPITVFVDPSPSSTATTIPPLSPVVAEHAPVAKVPPQTSVPVRGRPAAPRPFSTFESIEPPEVITGRIKGEQVVAKDAKELVAQVASALTEAPNLAALLAKDQQSSQASVLTGTAAGQRRRDAYESRLRPSITDKDVSLSDIFSSPPSAQRSQESITVNPVHRTSIESITRKDSDTPTPTADLKHPASDESLRAMPSASNGHQASHDVLPSPHVLPSSSLLPSLSGVENDKDPPRPLYDNQQQQAPDAPSQSHKRSLPQPSQGGHRLSVVDTATFKPASNTSAKPLAHANTSAQSFSPATGRPTSVVHTIQTSTTASYESSAAEVRRHSSLISKPTSDLAVDSGVSMSSPLELEHPMHMTPLPVDDSTPASTKNESSSSVDRSVEIDAISEPTSMPPIDEKAIVAPTSVIIVDESAAPLISTLSEQLATSQTTISQIAEPEPAIAEASTVPEPMVEPTIAIGEPKIEEARPVVSSNTEELREQHSEEDNFKSGSSPPVAAQTTTLPSTSPGPVRRFSSPDDAPVPSPLGNRRVSTSIENLVSALYARSDSDLSLNESKIKFSPPQQQRRVRTSSVEATVPTASPAFNPAPDAASATSAHVRNTDLQSVVEEEPSLPQQTMHNTASSQYLPKRRVSSPADVDALKERVMVLRRQLRAALFDVYASEVNEVCRQIENKSITVTPYTPTVALFNAREARVKAMCSAWGLRPVSTNANTMRRPPKVTTRLESSGNVLASAATKDVTSLSGSVKNGLSLLDLIDMQNEPEFDHSSDMNEFKEPKNIQPGMRVRAIWDYSSMLPDELTLQEDDTITVLKVQEGGWWQGEIDNRVGWFPSNYTVTHQESPTGISNGAAVENHTPASIRMQLAPSGSVLDLHDQNRSWYKKYKESGMNQEGTIPRGRFQTGSRKKFSSHKEYDRLMRQTWVETVPAETTASLCEREIQRQERIFELLKTEREYVNDLDVIIEVFLKPMAAKKLVSAKDAGILFSNVEQLLTVHQELLRLLESLYEQSRVVDDIGPVFHRMMDFFKLYTLYCSNHSFAILKYKSINSKPLRKFVEECARQPECRMLDLPGFLIKPVQRICKYPLLLKEILEKTDPSSSSIELLKPIVQKIETIVTMVNESIRQSEGHLHSADLQNRFIEKINVATPTRKLLREDTVHLIDEADKKLSKGKLTKKENLRNIFLFNDLFILAKPMSNDKLSLLLMLSYDSLQITSAPTEEDGHERFHIENTSTHSRMIVFTTPEVKAVWVRLGKKMMENQSRRKNSSVGIARVPSSNKVADHKIILAATELAAGAVTAAETSSFAMIASNPARAGHEQLLTTPGDNRRSHSSDNSEDMIELQLQDFPHGMFVLIQEDLYANPDEDEVSNYYYALDVITKNASSTTYKSYDDFFNLHLALLDAFPIEAGLSDQPRTLPELPSQRVLVSYTVARDRIEQLDQYIKRLLQLPVAIALSPLVEQFLQPADVLAASLARYDIKPRAAVRASHQ